MRAKHANDVTFVQVDSVVRPVSVSPMPTDAAIAKADRWLGAAIAALPVNVNEVPGLSIAEAGRQHQRRLRLEQQRIKLRDAVGARRAEDQRAVDLRKRLVAVESLITHFEQERSAAAELARNGTFAEAREAGRALRTCDDCLAVLTGRMHGGFLSGSPVVPTALYDEMVRRHLVVRGTAAHIETPRDLEHRIATVDARKAQAVAVITEIVREVEKDRRG
jgi:hypothetical protein